MAIPESQLDTWSAQGSVTQSCNTYEIVKNALQATNSGYADKSFEVFLQGSYGNDTNVYAESDVDVVICLDSTFRFDLDNLDEAAKQAYRNYVSPATYSYEEFKAAVVQQLCRRFGSSSIVVGSKAVTIAGDQNRRDADVIVCYEYRNFQSFSLQRPTDYALGIVFPTPKGEIINYPKQHSASLTTQHQADRRMLKPMVRIVKNMRNRMLRDGALNDGVAPSYFIEGMLYNVPSVQFIGSYGDIFCNCVNWLSNADRSKLICPNQQYWLLGNSNVQWPAAKCDAFLDALGRFWNNFSA
jgi:hypothetical protein